jgi:CrcB protein
MPVLVAIAIGGALGALSRYGVDRLVELRADSLFPWATFAVNLSGCFALAVVVSVVVDRTGAPSWLALGLTFGFLGAYTTFSTFAFEIYELTELRHVALAALYAALSIGGGVVAVMLGLWLGRR